MAIGERKYFRKGLAHSAEVIELPVGSPYIGPDGLRFKVYKYHEAAVPSRVGGSDYETLPEAVTAADDWVNLEDGQR